MSMSLKAAVVEKILTVVEECEDGLKKRSEGRFRPKSLTYAIDPRMVQEVRAYFDGHEGNTATDPTSQRLEQLFLSLGEMVRLTFTPHLDGSVYVTGKELTRIRTIGEQFRAVQATAQSDAA
jgi:hypothetical protein